MYVLNVNELDPICKNSSKMKEKKQIKIYSVLFIS